MGGEPDGILKAIWRLRFYERHYLSRWIRVQSDSGLRVAVTILLFSRSILGDLGTGDLGTGR
jgi:hypothetical protein